jgi:hypothetical protein
MSEKSRRRAPGSNKLVPGLKLFVVQRRSWRMRGEWFEREDKDGGVPERAFVDRAKAEAQCAELEAAARRVVSPIRFIYGDIEEPAAKKLVAGLQKLGVPPPSAELLRGEMQEERWAEWWDGVSGELTDAQREGVWALLKRLFFGKGALFYEVVETELDTDEKEKDAK